MTIDLAQVHGLLAPEWLPIENAGVELAWRDGAGDALTLRECAPSAGLLSIADLWRLRAFCREQAETLRAGLVEVGTAAGAPATAYYYITKEPALRDFDYSAVVEARTTLGAALLVASCAGGACPDREAVIHALLARSASAVYSEDKSRLLADLSDTWWQDPYRPDYTGVPRHALCSRADASEYDGLFPMHALSRVRRHVRRMLDVATRMSLGGGPRVGPT